MFCPSSLLLAIGVMMGPLFWMGPFDTIGGETQEALPRSLLEKKLCTPTPRAPGPLWIWTFEDQMQEEMLKGEKEET